MSKRHFNEKYTDEELLEILKNYSKIKFPTYRDFNSKNGLPSGRTYVDRFGSFQNAILKAGIEIPKERIRYFNREQLPDNVLLDLLKQETEKMIKKENRLLTAKEITANKNLPTDSVYHKRFGSLTEAYRLIGYDVNTFNKEKFKLELANKYKELAKMLNRTPTSRDLDFYSKKRYCSSASTYIAYFGSIHDLQKYCGLIPTEAGRGKTKEELIQDLIWLKNELGRTPNQLDLNNYPQLASPSTYILKFGSFVNALNEAGMESNKYKVYYTKSGTKCFSRMEHLFAQMLEKYKIPYKKDVKYSTWIKNIDKKYTFDFVIEYNNKKYFVEIFGIEGNEFYNKNKNKKIEICKKNNIPLICLHFDFFWRVKQKEMYNNLILKIKEIDQKLTI